MEKIRVTRRTVVQTVATAVLATPFVRRAHAAGKLAVGFWDHWISAMPATALLVHRPRQGFGAATEVSLRQNSAPAGKGIRDPRVDDPPHSDSPPRDRSLPLTRLEPRPKRSNAKQDPGWSP